jgi:hypothetical protein
MVVLEPGPWGLLAAADGSALPTRGDLAGSLRREGLTTMRLGGSMTGSPTYRWRSWRGPPDLRQPGRLLDPNGARGSRTQNRSACGLYEPTVGDVCKYTHAVAS